MMRVLHVIGAMDRGGAETMIMNLYRAMDRPRGSSISSIMRIGAGSASCSRRILNGPLFMGISEARLRFT